MSYTTASNVYESAPGCRPDVACKFFTGSHYFQPDDIEVFYNNAIDITLKNSTILTDHCNSSYLSALNGFLTTVIPQSTPSNWVRCWHAVQDGWDTRKTFHPQCDGKKATVTIVRVGQYIFGGFTDKSWFATITDSCWSSKAFLFSLYNTNGFQPVQLNLIGADNQYAFYGNKHRGPVFGSGHDLYIANMASSGKTSYTTTSTVYQPAPGCTTGAACTFFTGSHYFQPDDIEVFFFPN